MHLNLYHPWQIAIVLSFPPNQNFSADHSSLTLSLMSHTCFNPLLMPRAVTTPVEPPAASLRPSSVDTSSY
jgi:hypothetical protein